MEDLLAKINHRDVASVISIERKVLNLMEGGCQLPLGVYCPDVNTAYVAYARNSSLAARHFCFDLENMSNPAEQIVSALKSN